ncbi:hypothetical protein HZH68_009899 [Vespula germanica]|uniref:Uncharacterized protein n=1 Tax=Vespula germanica TaxID=30212 RepID=A0A834JZG6_VESGE|nr:hypothetical protein HZH68_009899 [Vespula germanica]
MSIDVTSAAAIAAAIAAALAGAVSTAGSRSHGGIFGHPWFGAYHGGFLGSSFWTGTPVGTSSSIGQRVVVLETAAEGGGGGGGGGEITTSGSPPRSQSNLQRMLSGWSPPV